MAFVCVAALGACRTWQPVSPGALRRGAVEIRTRPTRVVYRRSTVTLVVHRVSYPFVEGSDAESGRERRISLVGARAIDASVPDRSATAGVIFGVCAAIGGVLWLLGQIKLLR